MFRSRPAFLATMCLLPGVYLVVASGMAGYNNAFWKSEVKIEPGVTVKLRMSEPEVACLKMDSQ